MFLAARITIRLQYFVMPKCNCLAVGVSFLQRNRYVPALVVKHFNSSSTCMSQDLQHKHARPQCVASARRPLGFKRLHRPKGWKACRWFFSKGPCANIVGTLALKYLFRDYIKAKVDTISRIVGMKSNFQAATLFNQKPLQHPWTLTVV